MPQYYHYTTWDHFQQIRELGVIFTTESNVSLSEPHKGPDVVWLFAEPLKTVPEMMMTYHLNESREWSGYMVSKAQIEIEVTLEKSEVTRADKFLKKHGASEGDMDLLERAGKFKFINQYVTEAVIQGEQFSKITPRRDLMTQRKGTPIEQAKLERMKQMGLL